MEKARPSVPSRSAPRSRFRKVVEAAGSKHAQTDQPSALSRVHVHEPRTWQEWRQQLIKWVNGNEGVGLAISFLVHVMLLALMAVPVFHAVIDEPVYTTVVPDSDVNLDLASEVSIDAALPEVQLTGGPQQMPELVLDESIPMLKLDAEEAGTASNGGEQTGLGDAAELGGNGDQPKNAVVAGNFAAWPVPIISVDNNNYELGEAGKFPKTYQDYFIVIQVRLPESEKSYRISDLSGRVVGSDQYTQLIPARAFVKSKDGTLNRAVSRRVIRVKDHIAQLYIHVPGAAAFVQDRINIHSKILDEEQNLELTFSPAGFERLAP